MRPWHLARLSIVAVVLAGCASAPAATPTSTPSTDEPTPTPAPETLVIGPPEMPPQAFGGDCANVLAPADISEILGVEMLPATESADVGSSSADYSVAPDVMANAGGVRCEWTGEGSLRVGVVPAAALEGAVLPPAWEAHFFEGCDAMRCGWQGQDDELWIALELSPPSATDENKDAVGSAIASRIRERHDGQESPWTRDRAGWWPAVDCSRVADAVGSRLGEPLTGAPPGEVPIPQAADLAMVSVALKQSVCNLSRADGTQLVTVWTYPGMGAGRFDDEGTEVDLGVPGWTGHRRVSPFMGEEWTAVDGLNRVDIWTPNSLGGPPPEIVVAVAAAAASGFE